MENLTVKKVKCVICKKPVEVEGLIPETKKRLLSVKVCYKCDTWIGNWQIRDSERVVRIKGQHYIIGDPNDDVKGHGGRKFIINFNDGRVVVTDNLWHQSNVPEDFALVLADNATFGDIL